MELKSCYITGFGRLRDYSYEFKPGLNQIIEENGWGKSTFATFLKAMFYGMEYSSRKKSLTEREHYQPWDGGIYGGSLTFEANHHTYRIERTFGKKDSEDTFLLIDVETGQESADFTENIGEELFGVDRDSYEKSIYIAQQSTKTQMTDSLNAKMGDLQAARDDISQFDQAIKRLDDTKKDYIRNTKANPGKKVILHEQILASEELVEEIPTLQLAYDKKRELLYKRRADLRHLEAQKSELAKKITERSKKEQELGAYREKKEQLDRNREKLASLDDFFAMGIPTEEEQTAAEECEHQVRVYQASIEEQRGKLPSTEDQARLTQLFPEGVPSEEELSGWKADAARLMELRAQAKSAVMQEEDKRELVSLREYFQAGMPDQDLIQNVQSSEQNILKLDGQLHTLEDNLEKERERIEEQEENTDGGTFGNILFGVILTALFIGGGFAFWYFVGGALANTVLLVTLIAGIAIIIITILSTHRTSRQRRARKLRGQDAVSEIEDRIAEIEEEELRYQKVSDLFLEKFPGEEQSVLDRLREVQRKMDRLNYLSGLEENVLSQTSEALEQVSELQMSLYTALHPYAESYGMDLYHEMNENELLSNLSSDMNAMTDWKETEVQLQDIQTKEAENRTSLSSYLNRFPEDEEHQESTSRLATIRSNVKLYRQLTDEVEEATEALKQYETIELAEGEKTVEELQAEQEVLDAQISELNQFIPKDVEDVSQISESLVQHEDEREHLAAMQEEETRMAERVNILSRTADYLNKAREKFLLRYMRPMQDGMKHYLSMMDLPEDVDIPVEEYEMDMDLTVRFLHRGQTRTSAYLSAGYQDLTSLCARFALIDVLYREEKPTVILDDSFINLDEDKLKAGLHLLGKLSEERQIIYFTCHESRCLESMSQE